jgi:hypothetical protein
MVLENELNEHQFQLRKFLQNFHLFDNLEVNTVNVLFQVIDGFMVI